VPTMRGWRRMVGTMIPLNVARAKESDMML
jgi:hypothetical protein